MNALAADEANLVKKFASLLEHGRRFANIIANKAAESRDRIRQLHEPLVIAMNRVLSLALPNELERAKGARDAVLKLHDDVIDEEFEVDQLEARKRHSVKRRASSVKLQVYSPQGCVRTVTFQN